jgi:hypothetical protein
MHFPFENWIQDHQGIFECWTTPGRGYTPARQRHLTLDKRTKSRLGPGSNR